MEALYSFDSGRSKRAIAENRWKAEELKEDKGFVFAVRYLYSVFLFITILIPFTGSFRRKWEAQGHLQLPNITKGGKQDVVQK